MKKFKLIVLGMGALMAVAAFATTALAATKEEAPTETAAAICEECVDVGQDSEWKAEQLSPEEQALNARWEALWAEEEALYQKAGLYDENVTAAETEQDYAAHLRSLNVLSDQEVTLLLDNEAQTDALYQKLDALYAGWEQADEAGQVAIDAQAEALYNEIEGLWAQVDTLYDKIVVAEQEAFIRSLTKLTAQEQQRLRDINAEYGTLCQQYEKLYA